MAPKGEFLAYINPKEAGILRSMGGSGKMTPMGIPSFTEDEEDQLAMDAPDYSTQDFEEQAAIDAGEPTAQMSTMARDFQGFGPGDNLSDLQAPTFFQNLGTGVSNVIGQGRRGQNILNFLNRSTATTMRGRLGLGKPGDINYILQQLQSNKGDPVAIGLTNKQFEIGQKLIDAGIKNEADIRGMTQSQFDTLFPGPQTGEGEGGDSEPIRRLQAPITEAAEKEEPKNEFNELLKFYGSRFADGGEVREGYFGGGITKALKKAVGAVKKVAKSPIGKAALIGGLGYLGATKTGVGGELFTKFKNLSALQKALLVGGTAATLSPFAMEEEDEEEKLPTAAQSDPEFQNLLAYYGGPRRFAEEGGDIEDAPKEKPSGIMMASNIENDEILENLFEKYLDMGLSPKDAADKAREEFEKMSKAKEPDRMTAQEGGLMNLGGNEMDLRGGGFVPLGAKEKADDVPARLSKNEFVFTADAVRAAGGGSVDRGADIMYKTMKNLENKVA